MYSQASFLLITLGITSQFAYGFSLKPQNPNALHNIFSGTRNFQKKHENNYASITINQPGNAVFMRGGSSKNLAVSSSSDDVDVVSSQTFTNKLASLWAASGVVMILGKSIKRILPIAMEPFNGVAKPLSTLELISYIGMCIWFAYVEGYKGFQLKFSPLVVARAQTLKPFTKGSPVLHTLFGPLYAMGLFHATKKRKIVSWSVTLGVGVIVAAVKRFPYPWRNIIDAGVIVGLSWGSLSIAIEWVKAVVLGIETKMDPALPE